MFRFLDEKYGVVIDSEEILLHMLWADDLILLTDSKEAMQRQLDGLYSICGRYQPIVNPLKTKVLIFGKEGIQTNIHVASDSIMVIWRSVHYINI